MWTPRTRKRYDVTPVAIYPGSDGRGMGACPRCDPARPARRHKRTVEFREVINVVMYVLSHGGFNDGAPCPRTCAEALYMTFNNVEVATHSRSHPPCL